MNDNERMIANKALLDLAEEVTRNGSRCSCWDARRVSAERIRDYAHRTYARPQITIGGCVVTAGDEDASWYVDGAVVPGTMDRIGVRRGIRWLVLHLCNQLGRDLTPAEYTSLWNFST